jgi:hypothetical protein
MVVNARTAARHVVGIAVGGGTALAGVIVLLIGLGSALAALLTASGVDRDIASWLGHLLVGAVVAAIGLVVVQTARHRLQQLSLVPDRTVRTLKDDKTWAKERLQSHERTSTN